MRQGGGRAKGNGFENTVAKLVISAFSEFNIQRDDCYRTPSSGGHRFAKQADPGDLVISEKLRSVFPFEVEAKFYKKLDLYPFFDLQKNWPKSWPAKAWLAQTVKACAHREDVHPMLVFKTNNHEVLCAIPKVYPLVAHITRGLTFQYDKEEWFLTNFDRLLRTLAKHQKGDR